MHSQTAAVAADDAYFSIGHLALRLNFVIPKLLDRLGNVECSFKMSLRQQSAVSIERQLSADPDPPILDEILAFALGAETVIFESDQGRNRKTIIDLREVHIFGAQSGHPIGHL